MVSASSRPANSQKWAGDAPLRVMIVDDSLVARRVITRILEDDGRFFVAGSFSNAAAALDALSTLTVDLVLLDIEMPGRNGVESLPDLLVASNSATIVMLSGHHDEHASIVAQAVAKGARDIITKPAAGHFSTAYATSLADRLLALSNDGERAIWTAGPRRAATPTSGLTTPPRAVGIGASTGGINALTAFLNEFDRPARSAIFVTQHLPADFVPFFAVQLARQCAMPVHVAENGMLVAAGHVYLAPGTAHLTVQRSAHRHVMIRHSHVNSRHAAYPAVDPMLSSLAEIYGDSACAIILSGMGRDGLAGAESISKAGGAVIAQDSASSVVWGMPGVVVQAGLANLVLPPDQAAKAIIRSWAGEE